MCAGIEVVEDRLRQLVRAVEPIEEPGKPAGVTAVGHRIEARVGAELMKHPRVVVSHRADMELLRPAALVVPEGQFIEQGRAETRSFLGRGPTAATHPGENAGRLQGRAFQWFEALHSMVGKPAAGLVEEIVPLPQGLEEAGESVADIDAAHLGQMVDVVIEALRRVDRQGPVGPEGRQHADLERRVGCDRRVVFQRIERIVGRADQHDFHLPHDAATRHVVSGEHCVAMLPNPPRRLGIEQAVADPQRPFEFQVGPVIERIAECLGHHLGPLFEFLPVRSVTCAIAFRDAGRAHRPPLVMIAAEPNLREVGEAVVLGDLPRRQMAMVVDDGQIAGKAVVQLDGAIALQKEVFRNENVAHVQVPKGGSAAANSAKHASTTALSTPEGKNHTLARARRITPFSNESV